MNKAVIIGVLTFSFVLSASENNLNNILNGNRSLDDISIYNQLDAITKSRVESQTVIDEHLLQDYRESYNEISVE